MRSRKTIETKNSCLEGKELPVVGKGIGGVALLLLLGILARSGGGGGGILGISGSFGGIPLGMGCVSLISTTTASDVRKVLATDAAFSKQHLTTCPKIRNRFHVE